MADTPRDTEDDKTRWLDSHRVARFMLERRRNDLKVRVNHVNVPVSDVFYNSSLDCIEIHLCEGEDLRVALEPLPTEDEGADE